MTGRMETKDIIKTIYGELQVESHEDRGNTIVFNLVHGELSRTDFSSLVRKCRKLGYLPFTVDEEPDRLFLIREPSDKEYSPLLRIIMAALTIASIFYAGYLYSAMYDSTSISTVVVIDLVLFFLPMIGFLLFREFGRYLAMRHSGIKYSIPLLIPDPIFFGTGGSIASTQDAYRDRRSMIECGGTPVLFGFVYSIIMTVVGGMIYTPFSPSGPISNTPYITIGYPAIIFTLFRSAVPANGALNPLTFTGWIGLFVSALNFMPLGVLDGGLFWKGIFGGKFRYISYASAVLMVGAGLLLPEIIIIAVFPIFLGINGIEPLNDSYPLPHYVVASLVVVALVLMLAMIPLHQIPPHTKFSMKVDSGTQVVIYGSTTNVTENGTIQNLGNIAGTPSLSVYPHIPFVYTISGTNIKPGGSSNFTMFFNTSEIKPGLWNYTVTLFYGAYSVSSYITFLVVNLTDGMLFNNQSNPFMTNGTEWKPMALKLHDTTSSNLSVRLFVVTSNSVNYSISLGNISTSFNASQLHPGISVTFEAFGIVSGGEISISFTAKGDLVWAYVIAVDSYYNGAVARIDYT